MVAESTVTHTLGEFMLVLPTNFYHIAQLMNYRLSKQLFPCKNTKGTGEYPVPFVKKILQCLQFQQGLDRILAE